MPELPGPDPDPAPPPGVPRDPWADVTPSGGVPPMPWPPDPGPAAGPPPGYLPPDPDEPPPVELWRVVGDVPPWGSVILLLAWALMFAGFVWRRDLGDAAAYIAHGASLAQPVTRADAWRLLASTFVHEDLAHLFFNSLAMVVFGPAVERIFGRAAFLTVFTLGGLIASLASVAWRFAHAATGAHLSIGASGALFALAGALLTGAWRLRHRLAVGRARALAAAILFFSVPAIAQGFQRVGIDNAAHLGGIASGLVLGAVVPLSDRLGGPRPSWALRALGALAALALAACYVRAWRGG